MYFKLRINENLLTFKFKFLLVISSSSLSPIWTDNMGTSKQGVTSLGLFARNSTIWEAVGRSLDSRFQQEHIKPTLQNILKMNCQRKFKIWKVIFFCFKSDKNNVYILCIYMYGKYNTILKIYIKIQADTAMARWFLVRT